MDMVNQKELSRLTRHWNDKVQPWYQKGGERSASRPSPVPVRQAHTNGTRLNVLSRTAGLKVLQNRKYITPAETRAVIPPVIPHIAQYRSAEPTVCVPKRASGKISLARGIHCCPKFLFTLPDPFLCIAKDMFTYINTHIHISDCIQTLYELPLLPNKIASKTFLHKSGVLRSVEGIFTIAATA